MPNLKINFETPSFLQSLFAYDQKLLKLIEKDLEVKLVTRDAWVDIIGDDENIKLTKEVFEHLEYLVRKKINITPSTFKFTLEEITKKLSKDQESSSESNISSFAKQKIIKPRNGDIILPKTKNQLTYLENIDKFNFIFALGAAGSGKTYLAVAKAIQAYEQQKVEKIILSRPAVEAGEALGYLPGDLENKIYPYLRPLYDALFDILGHKDAQNAISKQIIEIAPLAYMRGRTLSNAFVILDEAQNTSREQMLMFLTRIGENSKAIITGDPSQIDLHPKSKSGILEAKKALNHIKEISFIEFQSQDIVRHKVVAKIIKAYENYRKKDNV